MSIDESPGSWETAQIGDLCELINGRGFKKSERAIEGLPIIRIQNLKSSEAAFNYFDGEYDPKILIEPGDLLFAWSGTPGTSFGAFIWKGPLGVLNQHIFKVLVASDSIDRRFFRFALNQRLQSLIGKAQGGVGLRHITKKTLVSTIVVVPPFPEQRRIVTKVEALQARSRSARAALEAIPPLLDKFRRSVLAAAFRGDLTADWRAKNPDVEPASVLFERILAERSRRWEEAELAKMEAKGKVPNNDKWKSKYKEPVAPDVDELPRLLEGWCWATIDQLGFVQSGLQKGKKRKPTEETRRVPYLRVANVQRGYLDLAEVSKIDATDAEIEKLRLRQGDVLFNEGGDLDKLGRGWIWQCEIDLCIHQNHVFRFRQPKKAVKPRLISWFGNSEGKLYFLKGGKQTTNLASLNSTTLKMLPIPLLPSGEQSALVNIIEGFLTSQNELKAQVDQALESVGLLDQAILKKAFEGRLVPQDPNDEPASVLLERIRRQREAAAPVKKWRRSKKA